MIKQNTFSAFMVFAALIFLADVLLADDRADFAPRSMAYVLQADKLARTREGAVNILAGSDRDLIILDHSYATGQDGMWTASEINAIRSGRQNRKVVAYISIGEAEDYRQYWREAWDKNKDGKPDIDAAPFLNTVNPEWEGNYKVRYWHRPWQRIILKYVDEIIARQFDGIYLDIIDAFEFYEYDPQTDTRITNRKNPETGGTYRRDMIAWVKKIAFYARQSRPGFLIIPQNGSQLLEDAGYLNIIDAIGIEDLFTLGNRKNNKEQIKYVLEFLKHAQKAGKPVLLIEYGRRKNARNYSRARAREYGFRLLLTDRDLKTMGIAANIPTSTPHTGQDSNSDAVNRSH